MFRRKLPILCTLAVLLLPIAGPAPSEASVRLSLPGEARALSGTFTDDDDVRLFDLVISGTRALTLVIETLSYAGGTLLDGAAVPRGGFDPIIALFDAGGGFIARGSDDLSKIDAGGDRNAYDDIMRLSLAPGDYILSVSQHRNTPPANLDFLTPGYGFMMAGWSDYTSWDCGAGNMAPFCDVAGAQRNGTFVVQVSSVPLPGSLVLLAGALAAAAGLRRVGRAV